MPSLRDRLAEAHAAGPINPDAAKWEVSPDDLPQNMDENDPRITTGELEAIVDGQDQAVQRISGSIDTPVSLNDTAANYASEQKERAAKVLRKAGRGALTFLKGAGMLTYGIGVHGGRAASRAVVKSSEAIGNGMMAAGAKLEEGADYLGDKLTAGVDKVTEKVDSVKETATDMAGSVRESLSRRATAAKTRKYVRHANWMNIKREAKEFAGSFSRKKVTKKVGSTALFNY